MTGSLRDALVEAMGLKPRVAFGIADYVARVRAERPTLFSDGHTISRVVPIVAETVSFNPGR